MAIPKFDQTFLPILKVLKNGQVVHRSKLPELLIKNDHFNLTEEELQRKTDTGYLLFHNRVGWGIAYLKHGKFIIQPERGYVQITDKGKALIDSETPTFLLPDLKQDSDYQAREKRVKEKKQTECVEELSPQEQVDQGIRNINASIQEELLDKLREVDPYYFQKIVLVLFNKMGYGDFIETPKSGDGGIDGIINQDQLGIERIYIQAKRYKDNNNVREPDIRNFIGAMSGDVNKGIFVTTSKFDERAVKKARDDRNHTFILIDGEMFAELMIKYNVGVQVRETYEMKEIDEDFFEQG